jgi:hypothetical protein
MSQWHHTDLTSVAGGPATQWAMPFAYVDNSDFILGPITRVVYVTDWGNGGDIHEIRKQNGTWMPDADLSTLLTNYSGTFQAQTIAVGYQTPDGVPRVVLMGQDNWIYEFKLLSDGWTVANLSAIAGMTQFPQPGEPSWPPLGPWQLVQPFGLPVWPYVTVQDPYARVVYWGTDGHVHELSLLLFDPSAAWIDTDLNVQAIAGGWDAPNTINDPYGYLSGDLIPRVVFNDANSYGVQELRKESGGWICANIGGLANAPPGLGVNSSAYVTPDAIARVVYIGDDGDAHELILANDQSPWIHTNLTSDSGTQTTPTSMLYGCCGNDSIPRAVYLGSDNDIHLFSYQNGGWIDEDLFQNDIVVGAPAGGIASTGWGGLIPYIFQVDGIVQIVYTGADQHIHLLSQILPGAQIRPRRLARIANLRSRLPGTSSDRSRQGGHAGRFQDRPSLQWKPQTPFVVCSLR